jgi:dTDP-4-amino-4,6-dideoxygalactose transaminase
MKVSYPLRSKQDFLVFGSPLIEEDEISEVVSTLRSSWIGTGPRVARFEEDFKTYKNAYHAVAVNSCTAALHLSLLAAGLDEGDEVITTALTFCSTVNAIIHAKAKPVLVDVEAGSMNIDPDKIREAITPRTRAILPVHFAGRPCRMDIIRNIADEHSLKIIEDAAHAVEAEYKGKKTGTFGDFGCFSFYATKNITTGEGGMVLAKHEEDAAKIKMLALHGMSKDAWKRFSDEGYKHYYVTDCGFKYNMMDIQAAIGIHQLKRVELYWLRRQIVWDHYNESLKDLPITLPTNPAPDTRHSYHLYTILIDEKIAGISRDQMLDAMTRENIGVGVHYLSIPEHPYYQKNYGWSPEDYPNAMRIGRQTLSLPISAKLTDKDTLDVIEAVCSALQK